MPTRLDARGCSLSFTVRGSGPPVLLLAGLGASGKSWAPQIEELSKEYECLSFDSRGVGMSQPPGTRVTVAQMAEDGLTLMRALRWNSAHVVGHSLGGLVAQELAFTARERVRSLTLLCSYSNGRSAASFSPSLYWLGLRALLGNKTARRAAYLRLILPPNSDTGERRIEVLERANSRTYGDLRSRRGVLLDQLRAMREYDASRPLRLLAGIPTLVISAQFDLIAPPRLGRALADAIPGAEYREIKRASHAAPSHRTAEVNALLQAHLAVAEARRRKRGRAA
jgi:pimeloyl-ACP methyl ester carboxylesterase